MNENRTEGRTDNKDRDNQRMDRILDRGSEGRNVDVRVERNVESRGIVEAGDR